jgi:hypothetical protein
MAFVVIVGSGNEDQLERIWYKTVVLFVHPTTFSSVDQERTESRLLDVLLSKSSRDYFSLQLQEQMDIKFKKQFPTRKELEIVSSTRIWKRQDKAARTIQTAFREYIR